MDFRKATLSDLPAIEKIYADIHTAEEQGIVTIGWKRGVYPTAKTASDALCREDLFVQTADGKIVGTGIINRQQVDIYAKAHWRYPAPDKEIMVLHTLVISPDCAHKGYGRAFVAFYEAYAAAHGCRYLRIDTNARNQTARALYGRLGYMEIDILPTVFNVLPGVNLVLLEKGLGAPKDSFSFLYKLPDAPK